MSCLGTDTVSVNRLKSMWKGKRGYMRVMTCAIARECFPGLPEEIDDDSMLHLIFHADGEPFAYGENWGIVMTFADDDNLEVIRVH